MQLHITQILLLVSLVEFRAVQSTVHKKRSPLELGYVSFTQIPANNYKQNSHGGTKHAAVVTGKSGGTLHPKDVWVPGHVSHHAYIPAHHVVVHEPLLVTTHSLHFFDDDPFRRTYGGYGVGIGVGGHGHGHGYHVVFN